MPKYNILGVLGAVCFLIVPTVSIAGTYAYGSGETRSGAMRDAEYRGRLLAEQKSTCITKYASPENCKQDAGGWICWVDVANHRGSCSK